MSVKPATSAADVREAPADRYEVRPANGGPARARNRPPGFRVAEYLRDLRGLPHDLRVARRKDGPRGVWRELRKHTLDRVYRRERFLVLEHALDRLREAEAPLGVEIGVFTGPDWSLLAELVSGPKLRTFPRLVASGRTCLVAWRDGWPIGYAWLSYRVEPEFEKYPLPLPADAVFGLEVYVIPRERNHGVGAALVTERMRLAQGLGFRRAWRIVAHENQASLRAWSKSFGGDVRVVGEATFRRVLAWTTMTYIPLGSDPAAAGEAPARSFEVQPGAGGPTLFGLRVGEYLRDLRDFPGDAVLAWRGAGVWGVLEELRERTLARVFQRRRLLVHEQDLASVRTTTLPAGVEIRPFAGPDWSVLRGITAARNRRRFPARSARGRICLVAWREGRPIGYTWLSERIDPAIETYPLPLPADAMYGWDLYVVPSERNNGVGSALVSARLRLARERGFRRMWRIVAPDNRPSLRTLAKTAGAARVVGKARFSKLLGRTRASFHPPRPEPLGVPDPTPWKAAG